MPLAVVLAGGMVFSAALSQTPQAGPGKGQSLPGAPVQGPQGATASPTPHATATGSHYHAGVASRARKYYEVMWGVDNLTVRSVESGELIRFNYRVVDAARAQTLNDKKSEPFLFDQTRRVKLVIPSLEKVGQLRQSATPEAGKIYWMAFSNKGGYVKAGDNVSVVIADFRADGLVVERRITKVLHRQRIGWIAAPLPTNIRMPWDAALELHQRSVCPCPECAGRHGTTRTDFGGHAAALQIQGASAPAPASLG